MKEKTKKKHTPTTSLWQISVCVPFSRAVKSTVISLLHLIIRSFHHCVSCGFEPTGGTCETCEFLIAGVPGDVPGGFSYETIFPVSVPH